MGFFSFIGRTNEAVDEMARRAAQHQQPGAEVVASYIARLRSVKLDQEAFDALFNELSADRRLKAGNIIEIANGYSAIGLKPTSRTAALGKIKKRFVELVRQDGKNKAAEKARPW